MQNVIEGQFAPNAETKARKERYQTALPSIEGVVRAMELYEYPDAATPIIRALLGMAVADPENFNQSAGTLMEVILEGMAVLDALMDEQEGGARLI